MIKTKQLVELGKGFGFEQDCDQASGGVNKLFARGESRKMVMESRYCPERFSAPCGWRARLVPMGPGLDKGPAACAAPQRLVSGGHKVHGDFAGWCAAARIAPRGAFCDQRWAAAADEESRTELGLSGTFRSQALAGGSILCMSASEGGMTYDGGSGPCCYVPIYSRKCITTLHLMPTWLMLSCRHLMDGYR